MADVVVTGVSSGIGEGIAKTLIGKGFRVFGSVRKEADAASLKAAFGEKFVPLLFDVTDEAAVAAGAAQVREAVQGRTLAGLVNNAGIAVAGPLIYLPIDEFKKQMAVNVTGQVIAIQAFAPLLGVDGALSGEPGRIVNISSVGGRSATPFMAPYNASKFAIEGLSEALRRELLPFGIDVIVIAPGAVRSKIWDKADEMDVTRYGNTVYAKPLERLKKIAVEMGRKGLPAERIGEAVHTALTASSPKTRYTVTPSPMLNFVLATLPARMVDRIFAGQLKIPAKRGV